MATSRSDSRRSLSLRKDGAPGSRIRRATGAAIPPSPGRQSRRDRRPHHPRLPGAGHRDGRGLQRRGRERRSTSGWRTRRCASGPRRRPRATCGSTRIIEAAAATGADAIHPGYGFLAERAEFAAGRATPGLTFVGPDARGDRGARRQAARGGSRGDAGVPVVPGTFEPGGDRPTRRARRRRRETRERIGLPLLVKAAAGGGGRGMRRVERSTDLPTALARRVARGRGRVRRRPRLPGARDPTARGTSRCSSSATSTARSSRSASAIARSSAATRSWSRRRPRPGLTTEERASRCTRMAVAVASAAGLRNAATAEFLLRARRRVLFPRGQHAPPGRARRDRARERRRPRPRAAPHRRRPAAVRRTRSPRRRARRRPTGTRSRCASSAEDPGRDFAPAPGPDPALGHARRARASASTPASRRGSGPSGVRHPHREGAWSHAATGRRDRPAGAGAGRDRDRRDPDDAAVPPLRGRRAIVRRRRAFDGVGRRSTGTDTARPSARSAWRGWRPPSGWPSSRLGRVSLRKDSGPQPQGESTLKAGPRRRWKPPSDRWPTA